MKASGVLRSCRKRAGLTQAELAERLGTVQPVIARWESGARAPSFHAVVRAIRACGYEPSLQLAEWDPSEEALLQQWLRMTPIQRLQRNGEMLELEAWAQNLRRVSK